MPLPVWAQNLSEQAKRLIQPSIPQGQSVLPEWARNLSEGAKKLIVNVKEKTLSTPGERAYKSTLLKEF